MNAILNDNNNSHDSLEILLRKARAINAINQENLIYIHSRKGHQVVTKHKYSLQTKSRPYSSKKQKTQHPTDTSTSTDSNTSTTIINANDMFMLVDQKTTKNVEDIISSWRYYGENLMTEKIAIDYCIDRKLETFNDLVRLNSHYDRLLNQHSQALTDTQKDRQNVMIVLNNVELLQVAIGQIHAQILEPVDSKQINNALSSLMKNISNSFHTFQSEVSRIKFNFLGEIAEEQTTADIMESADCTELTCKFSLPQKMLYESFICSMQTYVEKERRFLLTADYDGEIHRWDLSKFRHVDSIECINYGFILMVTYCKDGVNMLASASYDLRIQIWDLSDDTNVYLLEGHKFGISALTLYEKDGKSILISGDENRIVKLWDLDNYSLIKTIEGHRVGTENLGAIRAYKYDNRTYLATCAEKMEIWSLEDYSLVKVVNTENKIITLTEVQLADKKMLISGDKEGIMKQWILPDHTCITSIKAHETHMGAAVVFPYDGKECLVTTADDPTIKIWNLQNNSLIKTINLRISVVPMMMIMINDRPCLATGDCDGDVKLYMEQK